MTTVGIICEYNPFHNGHEKQFRLIREQFGEACKIVCLMSGNFVQRGEPAIFDKHTRAKAAVACGADVVLELPILYVLSSAEGFADGAVRILTSLGIEWLCFGSETGDSNLIMSTARTILQPAIDERIKAALKTGISYAAAREQALETLFPEGTAVVKKPNDILAVEYCKAIIRHQSTLKIHPILRTGDYHAIQAEKDEPSATAIRGLLAQGTDISAYIPAAAYEYYKDADRYHLAAGERAMLARLNTMTEEAFSKLPYGSEGLWRRFMHACACCDSTSAILEKTKSKRYARTRLCRMLMCAVLSIYAEDFKRPVEYIRILSFSEQGRQVLRGFKDKNMVLIASKQKVRNSEMYKIENRCERMYSLFRKEDLTEAKKI